MWVGTQTSQVEIKLSLKACQVSEQLQIACKRVLVVKLFHTLLIPLLLLLSRFTSSTCALRTPNTPGSCDWCGRETSPTASRAASTPGERSKLPPRRQTHAQKRSQIHKMYSLPCNFLPVRWWWWCLRLTQLYLSSDSFPPSCSALLLNSLSTNRVLSESAYKQNKSGQISV